MMHGQPIIKIKLVLFDGTQILLCYRDSLVCVRFMAKLISNYCVPNLSEEVERGRLWELQADRERERDG
jgi:hypothetical protein